jgi:hypothetical protein
MIQVCSRCGTRWNVRDRRREWCPRCHGALQPPSTEPHLSVWNAPGHNHRQVATRSTEHRFPPRLPSGYRWIAVRPGSGPAPRRGRRLLGPTPRYAVIPRWGLVDSSLSSDARAERPVAPGPSPWAVRATLITTVAVMAAAAVLHLIRYVLLIINRDILLPVLVAGAATWLGVLASVGAFVSMIGCAAVLTGWLIARRGAAFDHRGLGDPRPRWALRLGCLIPVVNLVWAPVFVIELAAAEDRLSRLRHTIVVWWALFVASTVVSVFATATAFTQDAQGIANNTVSFIVAYLFATATVVAAAQVVLAFERAPVERPAHRWLVVPAAEAAESPSTVESEPEEPAA